MIKLEKRDHVINWESCRKFACYNWILDYDDHEKKDIIKQEGQTIHAIITPRKKCLGTGYACPIQRYARGELSEEDFQNA